MRRPFGICRAARSACLSSFAWRLAPAASLRHSMHIVSRAGSHTSLASASLRPATVEDARGMLWTALEDPDPVLVFEHQTLYNMEGELAPDAGPVDIDRAAVRRPGSDVSLITYGASVFKALTAADTLAGEGVQCEVIDLRTLRPLDMNTL